MGAPGAPAVPSPSSAPHILGKGISPPGLPPWCSPGGQSRLRVLFSVIRIVFWKRAQGRRERPDLAVKTQTGPLGHGLRLLINLHFLPL